MSKQQEAFEKLSRLKVGALFMEMGTGKTKVALDLIAYKYHKVDYVLWICPFSLKCEFETEKAKWHKELCIDIVGCETIGSSDRKYLEILTKVQNNKSFIVIDESLKIKNSEAKRTQRILKLGEYATYKLILNGTPLAKNVLDLWTQMQFLSPKILNMGYSQFKNTYTEYYLHGKLKGLVKKQHNIEHLIRKIEPYIFDSELDLSVKKQYINIPYRMSFEEREEYEGLKDAILNACMNMDKIDFFSLLQRLQSFYTGCRDRQGVLQDAIDEIDESVIVFVKFLKSIPQGAKCIIGDMSIKERQKVKEEFRQGKFKVLYITYGCGSYGLNLQFCRNIIFAEHTFDYAQRIQAEARIYRMGQDYDVTYYNLWCEIGLERLIQASLDKKSNLLDEVKKQITNQTKELKKLL